MTSGELPRVAYLPTGGTIDHLGGDRLDLAHYTELPTRLGGAELLARTPEIARIARVEQHTVEPMRGQAIGTKDLLELARAIERSLSDPDIAGAVVTRGTNTIEEAAYLAALTVSARRPVVFTASMRPASAMSGDGELNLVNAIRVAASPRTRDLGTVLVMNDTIFDAREATKTSTSGVDAFRAPGSGPLGHIAPDGTIRLPHSVTRERRALFALDEVDDLPRVDVLLSYVGADGALVEAAVAAGARGLVSAGLGTGRGTHAEEAAFDRAIAHGVVVVQSSRVGSGRVLRGPSMTRRRVVAGGDLLPWKARLLLALALTKTSDVEEIQELFDSS